MNQIVFAKQNIRFRCWSRKAYAIFASLGRCVTIGRLKNDVTDCSLSKQQKESKNIRLAECRKFDSIPKDDEEYERILSAYGSPFAINPILIKSDTPTIVSTSAVSPYNRVLLIHKETRTRTISFT